MKINNNKAEVGILVCQNGNSEPGIPVRELGGGDRGIHILIREYRADAVCRFQHRSDLKELKLFII